MHVHGLRPLLGLLAAALTAASCSTGAGATSGGAAPAAASGTPTATASPPAAPPPPSRTPTPVTLAFGGDVHFEGSSAKALDGALAPITPLLSAADVAMVNLETAVTTRGTAASKTYVFRAPPRAFTALRAAGVDVVSMANNHGLDFGRVGLQDSLDAARAARFPVVGIGVDEASAYAPWTTTVRGQRIAILGATQVLDDHLIEEWTAGPGKPGMASAKRVDRLVQAVRAARRAADTVVVHLHWGAERVNCPTQAQRSLADALMAAGADVIVGGHAHVPLGGGWRGSSYVDYGLGNFVFYKDGIAPTTETGVLTLTVRGRAVTDARWAPARIRSGVPVPATGAEADTLRARKASLRSCTDLAATPGVR